MGRTFTQYLQVLQVVDSNLDFKIGKVTVQCATFGSIQTAGDNPHEQPVQRGERAAGEHGEQVPQRPRPGSLEGGQASDQVSKQ